MKKEEIENTNEFFTESLKSYKNIRELNQEESADLKEAIFRALSK